MLVPGSDEVEVINMVSFTSVGTVTLGLTGDNATALTINPDGEDAYVTDETTHQVVTLDYVATSPYFAYD